jgi:hypothetical protein
MITPRLPRWITVWFALSLPLIAWDVSFVLLRPLSMPGGRLAFLWGPYAKYITVDLSYGDLHNPFVRAQALMSVAELVLALFALWLAHGTKRRALGTLLVFTTASLTCAKTLLIFTIEAVSGLAHIGHNSLSDMTWLYFVPNGMWIVVPLLVARWTGKALLARELEAPEPRRFIVPRPSVIVAAPFVSMGLRWSDDREAR